MLVVAKKRTYTINDFKCYAIEKSGSSIKDMLVIIIATSPRVKTANHIARELPVEYPKSWIKRESILLNDHLTSLLFTEVSGC